MPDLDLSTAASGEVTIDTLVDSTITLNHRAIYDLRNLAIDSAGADQTGALIFCSTDGSAVVADWSAAAGKFVLREVASVGALYSPTYRIAGVTTLKAKSTGAETTLMILKVIP